MDKKEIVIIICGTIASLCISISLGLLIGYELGELLK